MDFLSQTSPILCVAGLCTGGERANVALRQTSKAVVRVVKEINVYEGEWAQRAGERGRQRAQSR